MIVLIAVIILLGVFLPTENPNYGFETTQEEPASFTPVFEDEDDDREFELSDGISIEADGDINIGDFEIETDEIMAGLAAGAAGKAGHSKFKAGAKGTGTQRAKPAGVVLNPKPGASSPAKRVDIKQSVRPAAANAVLAPRGNNAGGTSGTKSGNTNSTAKTKLDTKPAPPPPPPKRNKSRKR